MTKLFLEKPEFMTLRIGHAVSWFPTTLAVMGSLALLVGIFVAVLSIPEVVAAGHPGSNMPSQGALYVGTNTCFTCHGDRPLDWSLTLYTQIVVAPSEQPQAVTNLKQGDHVQQIDANDMVDAYTTTNEGQSTGNSFHQYYVIKTEDGHILTPIQQNIGDLETKNSDSLSKCTTCHNEDSESKLLGFETVGLSMATKTDRVVITAMVFSVMRLLA